jgi:hypothetical protein
MKSKATEEASVLTRDEAIEKANSATEVPQARSDITQVERIEHDGAAKRYISWDILAFIGQIGMYRDLF